MEDFKIVKEIVNFGITVVLLLLICLLIYKLGKSIDTKAELNDKESHLVDLKIEVEKKNSRLLDKHLEINEIEKDE